MSKDFNTDLKVGDLGEYLWKKYLHSRGHVNLSLSSKDKPVYWDVRIDDSNVTFEIKYDEAGEVWAHERNRECNFFMEFWSETRGEECGILLLEADYLVYILEKVPCQTPVAHLFRVPELINHLRQSAEQNKYREVTTHVNGTGNVLGWIPAKSDLLKEECGFVKEIILNF